MTQNASGGVRRGIALLGVVFSAATLLVAAAIRTVPTLTPVGTAAAVVITATTLSLPVVAVGLLYSLRGGVSGAERLLRRCLLGAVLFFTTGTVAVVSGLDRVRTVGDWLYAVGIVVLLAVSVATLFVDVR